MSLPSPGGSFPAGPVILDATAEEYVWPASASERPAAPLRGRSALVWYGGTAGAVLVVGLTVVLALLLTGQLGSHRGPLGGPVAAPADLRPPLARLCPGPGPSAVQEPPPAPAPPIPAGPRISDELAGISYRAYSEPWHTWPFRWTMGTLEVPYLIGEYFVTERYRGGKYLASILSAAVPATVNDSTTIDIECTGHQVAADVRASYYPQPNTMDVMRAGRTTLGGRPAWATVFRLHFHEPGLKATDELVGVALIDVGRPTAAVLYVSIPGTHRQWDHVVNEVLDSVRPS